MDDSDNNNVDLNSNDHEYRRYAAYHNHFQDHSFLDNSGIQSASCASERPLRRDDDLDTAQVRISPAHQGDGVLFEEGLDCIRWSSSHSRPNQGYSRYYDRGHSRNSLQPDSQHWERDLDLNMPERFGTSQNQTLQNSTGWLWNRLHREAPKPEETEREAEELLVNFTWEEFRSQQVSVPECITSKAQFSKPAWGQAGMELRKLADAFARTEERRKVRDMAGCVNMSSMNMQSFFELCSELFSGPEGITPERIVALFTFIADIAIGQVKQNAQQFISRLMNWSLKYIFDFVCQWVVTNGGWGVVLRRGLGILEKVGNVIIYVGMTAAVGLYLLNSMRRIKS